MYTLINKLKEIGLSETLATALTTMWSIAIVIFIIFGILIITKSIIKYFNDKSQESHPDDKKAQKKFSNSLYLGISLVLIAPIIESIVAITYAII